MLISSGKYKKKMKKKVHEQCCSVMHVAWQTNPFLLHQQAFDTINTSPGARVLLCPTLEIVQYKLTTKVRSNMKIRVLFGSQWWPAATRKRLKLK
jgi:hypothetical protein